MKHMPLKLRYNLIETFDDDDMAFDWLFSDLTVFNGKTAIEMIEAGKVQEVIDVLGRIRHGIPS